MTCTPTKNTNNTNDLITTGDGTDSDIDNENPHISNLWEIHRKLDQLRGKMSCQHVNTVDLNSDDLLSDSIDENLNNLPPTYLIIEIISNIKENTLNWLIEKITGKRCNGGGELIMMRQPKNPQDAYILHISATKIKFLEVAEEMEIMKKDKFGVMREFTVNQLDDFLYINNNNSSGDDNINKQINIDNFLTDGEKQSIVLHELENIRALPEEKHIPGYVQEKLYEGQSIIQACIQANLIKKIYPLHDEEYLKKLSEKWYGSLTIKQPFEEIRSYFGESIALYFVFLDYYTNSLILPVILGILQLLFSDIETLPFFCLFNVVWVTLFLEMWKRKSNELAFKWGTIGMTSLDEPRPNFHGPMGYDAVTGKLQPQSPRYRTTLKMYLVSTPIVLLCMVGAFVMMLASFWAEDYVKVNYPDDQILLNLPSIVYSILVCIVNLYYRQLATYLTEWENHRTQSQYDRHRVTKLVLFEFVNNFMALFYIAFIIQDMEMLKSQLKVMLIILQTINNIQETILPLIINYFEIKMKQWRKSKRTLRYYDRLLSESDDDSERLTKSFKKLPKISKNDSRLDDVNKQNDMLIYEGTYDDYLELFIQFGYVFLFSSIYPISTIWALINNLLEIRCDAFKLCKIYQRPIKRRCKDIGAWQKWFEILNTISIITNCGLLCLCPQLRQNYQQNYIDEIVWILLFVLLEHLLLTIRYILHIAISDKPEWIRIQLAKRNYESKQALKFERAQRNRHLLKRKFKTVHGTRA